MVFLHQQKNPARKRPSPPPSVAASPCKISKPAAARAEARSGGAGEDDAISDMASVLADAGCTLLGSSGPPCLPSDIHAFRSRLNRLLSSPQNAPGVRSRFLAGFSSYIGTPRNLRRLLASSSSSGYATASSLLRNLLLVPAVQLDLQIMLLEKLPEYFDESPEHSGTLTSASLEDDVARMTVNHLRWLDFVVDSGAFTEKLMQVLSVCPLHLKKEIIGSLPEIIGDHNNKAVVDYLEQMVREDFSVVVPALDTLSNLNLDSALQDQVVDLALSCIRTIDGEHMHYLLRFLLLSATSSNVRRVISEIREQLKFAGTSSSSATRYNKLKGKAPLHHTEASVLHALRSSLLFNDVLHKELSRELIRLDTPQQHKVIDIWLLVLLHTKESAQKSIQTIFKKKIVENCFQETMLDQCICGNKELVQEYFRSFLSLFEYLLACKEQKAREFGIHAYSCLFEEIGEVYYRQEVIGALVTHVGSGISFEVNSALETISLLASKHTKEVISLSSYINGILDYLEGFEVDNIHKVYEIFSLLVKSSQHDPDCSGSSISNDLLMVVRKQVSHPDLKFKKIGLIGTLKIVSCLGDANSGSSTSSQKPNSEDVVELLKTSIDSCRQFSLPLILLYDELATILDQKELQPVIMEWIGKHVGEFESSFLSDLESGELPNQDTSCCLEGELWMNLDGDVSPICLSILPLASSSSQSIPSLQILPASFCLLSTVERLANQGSLGGIDALLGCPLHLPSSKYFSISAWQPLTTKQKHILCLSLYHAINWIKELLNSFCTQVAGRFENSIQSTQEDIIAKLRKRLRNLIFLESLLNKFMKSFPLVLPELHLNLDCYGTLLVGQADNFLHVARKIKCKKPHESVSSSEKTNQGDSQTLASLGTTGNLRQPTLLDAFSKAGVPISQDIRDDLFDQSSKQKEPDSAEKSSCDSIELVICDDSAIAKALEAQRFKFRPLRVECLSLLSFLKLPLQLYLLRELHLKLNYFLLGKQSLSRCSSSAAGFTRMTLEQFLRDIRPLFPHLRRHFDNSVSTLTEGAGACEEHWTVYSAYCGNPEIGDVVLPTCSASSVIREVLQCFSKMLCLPCFQMDQSVLRDLLEAFQASKSLEDVISKTSGPSPGTMEHLYLGASLFLEDVMEITSSCSFSLGFELLLALESIVTFIKIISDKLRSNRTSLNSESLASTLTMLRNRLGTSARKLLQHKLDNKNLENGGKNKEKIIQRILRIYLENNQSKSDLLHELACSILPRVLSSNTQDEEEGHDNYQTLTAATFAAWYRVLHEVNLAVFVKLVKEVVSKPKVVCQVESVSEQLVQIQRSVKVLVSLINMCRTQEKVTVHAMVVKYGGKFVDSFLKVFDFLQAHLQSHNELIIELVKELQKGTRTMQTICSEAKGMRQTVITSKIPATKRSMERFLFHVKALLHNSSSGCTFWMGNLKHKDLMGRVVSSQAYVDDENNNDDESLAQGVEDQCDNSSPENGNETE